MGASIAKGFRERYPRMYEEYRGRCKAQPRQFNLGDAWLWKDKRRPWVFNLGTQEGYWHVRASYEVIEESLTRLRAGQRLQTCLLFASSTGLSAGARRDLRSSSDRGRTPPPAGATTPG